MPSRLTSTRPDVLDPLVGREPPAAGRAVAPAADGLAGVGGAGIHHPVVVDTTPRTPHRQEPQDVVAARTLAPARRPRQPAGTTSELPTVSEPGRRRRWPTRSARRRPAGPSPGRTRCAIDQRVSPERHHDDLLCGGRRRFPPPDRARRQRAQEHSDQGCRHDGDRPAPANVRSLHAAQDGRTPVRCQGLGRTYVCTPPEPVLPCGPWVPAGIGPRQEGRDRV